MSNAAVAAAAARPGISPRSRFKVAVHPSATDGHRPVYRYFGDKARAESFASLQAAASWLGLSWSITDRLYGEVYNVDTEGRIVPTGGRGRFT